MTTTTAITMYRITASIERDGLSLDGNQPEVLGEAYGRLYADRDEAESLAAEMGEEAASGQLPPLDASVTYDVEEVTVAISDVEAERQLDGAIVVMAAVTIDGTRYDTQWSAQERNVGGGVDGLEPCGDSIDAWVDGEVARVVRNDETAVEIGEMVLAMVPLVPTQRGREIYAHEEV